ncbi:hypothetical protein PG994_013652 [Apiospora phragmitis]|uniref:Fungal calcium binding protein domain-containing protein n=1 Tax=Apiospora phragmitis TaxID=2905665 RepID=A0ABR1T989_9PEZI
MRFSAATVVAVLAGNAVAGPAVPVPVTSSTGGVSIKLNETMVEEAILFAIRPDADCSLGNCAGVVAAAACIALGIVRRSPSAVIKCVSGGASQLCGCASCVSALGDFLTEHNICSLAGAASADMHAN